MNHISRLWALIIIVSIISSCSKEDDNRNSNNGGGGGGGGSTLSLNSTVNQLVGNWRQDSSILYLNIPGTGWVVGRDSMWDGSLFNLSSTVSSTSVIPNCWSDIYLSSNTVYYFGILFNTGQGAWSIQDRISSCAAGTVPPPPSHRYFVTGIGACGPEGGGGGYLEFISASNLVLVLSSAPQLLPVIPSGSTGHKIYFTKIP
jgi:hypothetical protein